MLKSIHRVTVFQGGASMERRLERSNIQILRRAAQFGRGGLYWSLWCSSSLLPGLRLYSTFGSRPAEFYPNMELPPLENRGKLDPRTTLGNWDATSACTRARTDRGTMKLKWVADTEGIVKWNWWQDAIIPKIGNPCIWLTIVQRQHVQYICVVHIAYVNVHTGWQWAVVSQLLSFVCLHYRYRKLICLKHPVVLQIKIMGSLWQKRHASCLLKVLQQCSK